MKAKEIVEIIEDLFFRLDERDDERAARENFQSKMRRDYLLEIETLEKQKKHRSEYEVVAIDKKINRLQELYNKTFTTN